MRQELEKSDCIGKTLSKQGVPFDVLIFSRFSKMA